MNHKLMASVAGAGKTTALKRELETIKDKKVLLITFNKSLEVEAKELEKNNPNLKVTTYHGLAYRLLNQALGGFDALPEYLPSHILDLGIKGINSNKDTVLYLDLIVDFCHSKKTLNKFIGFVIRNSSYRKALGGPKDERIRLFKDVWEKLVERRVFTHDSYSKFFQLKKPLLNYEVIMIDEFQDFSESMISVIELAKDSSQLILAGDQNQRIYEWRGACGIFNIEFSQTENLFGSWRCPRLIVAEANPYTKFLSGVDMTSNKDIDGEVFIHSSEASAIEDLPKEDIAFLTRTNAYAFVLAEKLIRLGFGVKIESNVDFTGIENHWKWTNGEPVGNYLDQFDANTKKRLIQFYKDTAQDDRIQQLNCALDIVDFPKLKEGLDAQSLDNKPIAILTTVYKSKGLGFENIFIAQDFKSPFELDSDSSVITDEDLKLIYVAITRAIKKLYLHKKYHSDTEILEINPDYTYIEREEGEDMLSKRIREKDAGR